MKELAVVLLSGGMDSAVCAALAQRDSYEIAALHLNYGQRTQQKELECFENLCKHFGVKHTLVVDVSHLSKIGGSSLTDMNIEVPKAKLDNQEIPPTYVPFRNANILAIGVSWAEVIKARYIYIGAMEQDSSGYPDCRQSFFDAFNHMIKLGTKPETQIDIVTPIMNKTKEDIVRIGIELGVPFDYTWSCYKDNNEACGECDSCALRLRGFKQMNLSDPIISIMVKTL
ncbi:MAG TPA: 7-cyano-7-deazaguanine synthase QueC [Candidatus Kapabacteria bacterium]|nr:7-cyano-7-deazaguanine synthase QueC [Candidatus Kapabacteria bacterium]